MYLLQILKLYRSRGFIITDMFVDNEFNHDTIRMGVLPISLNIFSAGEHVPKIKKTIRTIKERCRSLCQSLPYNRYPKMMTRGLAYRAVQFINACLNERAVNFDLSPAGIVEGRNNPDF